MTMVLPAHSDANGKSDHSRTFHSHVSGESYYEEEVFLSDDEEEEIIIEEEEIELNDEYEEDVESLNNDEHEEEKSTGTLHSSFGSSMLSSLEGEIPPVNPHAEEEEKARFEVDMSQLQSAYLLSVKNEIEKNHMSALTFDFNMAELGDLDSHYSLHEDANSYVSNSENTGSGGGWGGSTSTHSGDGRVGPPRRTNSGEGRMFAPPRRTGSMKSTNMRRGSLFSSNLDALKEVDFQDSFMAKSPESKKADDNDNDDDRSPAAKHHKGIEDKVDSNLLPSLNHESEEEEGDDSSSSSEEEESGSQTPTTSNHTPKMSNHKTGNPEHEAKELDMNSSSSPKPGTDINERGRRSVSPKPPPHPPVVSPKSEKGSTPKQRRRGRVYGTLLTPTASQSSTIDGDDAFAGMQGTDSSKNNSDHPNHGEDLPPTTRPKRQSRYSLRRMSMSPPRPQISAGSGVLPVASTHSDYDHNNRRYSDGHANQRTSTRRGRGRLSGFDELLKRSQEGPPIVSPRAVARKLVATKSSSTTTKSSDSSTNPSPLPTTTDRRHTLIV